MRLEKRRSNLYGIWYSVAIMALPLTSIAGIRNHVEIHGGDVHFYGQVINAACSVAADSTSQTVQMGQIRSSDFKNVGDWENPVSFNIKLEDCSTSISQTAGVVFDGEKDERDPQVFQAGAGANASKGVGLGIFDSDGNLLVPDTAPPWFAPLQVGNNTLSYMAKYRSTDRKVEAGDASAQVWFDVVYQ